MDCRYALRFSSQRHCGELILFPVMIPGRLCGLLRLCFCGFCCLCGRCGWCGPGTLVRFCRCRRPSTLVRFCRCRRPSTLVRFCRHNRLSSLIFSANLCVIRKIAPYITGDCLVRSIPAVSLLCTGCCIICGSLPSVRMTPVCHISKLRDKYNRQYDDNCSQYVPFHIPQTHTVQQPCGPCMIYCLRFAAMIPADMSPVVFVMITANIGIIH